MKILLRIFLILFTIVLAVFLVNFAGLHFFKQQFKKIASFLPPEQQEQIEAALEQKKVFDAGDGQLIVVYKRDWIEIPLTNRELPMGEILFRAGKFTAEGKSAQLIVSEMPRTEKTPQEILAQMQESNHEQGWELTILASQEGEDELTFDALYETGTEKENLHSKEKILVHSQEKAYTVAVLASESDWDMFEADAKHIIEDALFAPK